MERSEPRHPGHSSPSSLSTNAQSRGRFAVSPGMQLSRPTNRNAVPWQPSFPSFGRRRATKKIRVVASKAQKYTLLQPQMQFRRLSQADSVRGWIQDNYGSSDALFMVVGYLTMTDASVVRQGSSTSELQASVDANVPVPAVAKAATADDLPEKMSSGPRQARSARDGAATSGCVHVRPGPRAGQCPSTPHSPGRWRQDQNPTTGLTGWSPGGSAPGEWA